MNPYQRSLRVVSGTLLVYVVLVATHLGEFWPFSIYPMFSKAGQPWSRAIVREVPTDADATSWESIRLDQLPGTAFPMRPNGINQNDIANYISKTDVWTHSRLRGFRSLFEGTHSFDRPLRAYRVRGTLAGDSVDVWVTPLLEMTADTTFFHPSVAVDLSPRHEQSAYASTTSDR